MSVAERHAGDDLRELYRELILDHARRPRHFGQPPGPTHAAEGINPLCGDKLKLYLCVDAAETISDAGFEGSGCAISVASASLLTDTVIGLHRDTALACFDAVTRRLCDNPPASLDGVGADLDKLRALDGVRDYPSRVKCATLAWHALHAALQQDEAPVTTE